MLFKFSQILPAIKSIYEKHGLAAPFIVTSRFLEYFYKRLFDKSYFVYAGNKYQYFYHLYNVTFRNERCVELPIVQHFLKNSANIQ